MSLNLPLTVAKFGGTSLKDYAAMLRCADIVLYNPSIRLVVVSASAGVTNMLVELASRETSVSQSNQLIADIKQVQYSIIESLSDKLESRLYIDNQLDLLKSFSEQLQSQYSLKLADEILAFGERFSSYIFTKILIERANTKAESAKISCIDAREIITTDSRFSHARPDLQAIQANSDVKLSPYLADNVYVTQGFVGQDQFGNTTTLGRGGSDFSAALLAEAVGADTLQIWTDVAGIYSSDPRIVANAKPIQTISFSEAAELATFGAKVLHPATLLPAIRAKIDVFVGSSQSPESGGTKLTNQISSPGIRAIALRENQTLVTLTSPNMLLASGFLARVFAILAKYELSVDLITTSEISVALTLDNVNGSDENENILPQACIIELEDFCGVAIEKQLSLVAVIGNHTAQHDSQSTTGHLFSSLSRHKIRMICHGASKHNICFLVKQSDGKEIVASIHDQIFG